MDRAKLRLYHLLVRAVAHFNDALVITLASFRNAEYVLPCGNIGENDAARTPDTSLPLVVDVNFGADRSEDHETRYAAFFGFVDILCRFFELFDPLSN